MAQPRLGRWQLIGASGTTTTCWTILRLGLVLKGSEIKSIRDAKVDISNAYVRISDGEAWLVNAYIAPYESAGIWTQHETATGAKAAIASQRDRISARTSRATGIDDPWSSASTSSEEWQRWRFHSPVASGTKIVEKRSDVVTRSAIWRVQCGDDLT